MTRQQFIEEITQSKARLVEDVARAAELTEKDAERLVEIVFERIIEALNQGEKIELRGFGSFRVRGARRARNAEVSGESERERKIAAIRRLRGIAEFDGESPSDEELKEDYINYLTEKYS
ncbi:MAG TPA: HU family DNA-binding protein [Pyrinomonadaceae bacterium]|jgi:integration host factor subunit beta